MADLEEYDEVKFKMVNGDEIRKQVPLGTGKMELAESFESTWLAIDEMTRIRTDKIVSVKLSENAHGYLGIG